MIRKKIAILIMLFIGTSGITSLISVNCVADSKNVIATWTIMIYLDGDNDLGSYAFETLENIMTSSTEVNIIVEFDGSFSSHQRSDTARYFISRSTRYIPLCTDLPNERNMGDPDNLREFVTYSMTDYPAEYYCLILWNHGSAWQTGMNDWEDYLKVNQRIKTDFRYPFITKNICWDERSYGDSLTERELREALTDLPYTLDLIVFDACLMGCIETAYSLHGLADYMVASEDSIAGSGFNLDSFTTRVHNYAEFGWDVSPLAMAKELVDVSYNEYNEYLVPEIAVIDLSQINELVDIFNEIVTVITSFNTEELFAFNVKIADIADFGLKSQVDITAMAQVLLEIDPSCQEEAEALINAVNDAVVYELHSEELVPSASGMTIYVPWESVTWCDNYNKLTFFGNDSNWDKAVMKIQEHAIKVTYGENRQLTSENNHQTGSLSENELVTFDISLHREEEILISLNGPDDSDFDIYLLDNNLNEVDSSEKTSYPERISYTALTAGDYMLIINAYEGSGEYILETAFIDGYAKIDIVACIDVCVTWNKAGFLDDIRLVLLIDSPTNAQVNFLLELFGYLYPEGKNNLYYNWDQKLRLGRQIAILHVRAEVIANLNNSTEVWIRTGEVIITESKYYVYTDDNMVLKYPVHPEDLGDNKIIMIGTYEITPDGSPVAMMQVHRGSLVYHGVLLVISLVVVLVIRTRITIYDKFIHFLLTSKLKRKYP